jgi:ComF family protein
LVLFFKKEHLTSFLDLLLPPHCPSCGTEVATQGTFCPPCFAALNFIVSPLCESCGLPFDAGRDRICPGCEATPPPWALARAAFLYDDASRRLILPLKYADRQDNAEVLATHMARVGRTLLAQADLLVPVPLHRWRLFRRGFNQAALLAKAVARRSGRPACVDALRRTRRTRVLGTLSAADRAAELAGAFAVRAGRAGAVRGRRVVLIDDVLTSGATAGACAKALLDAGARHVDVLVASRVPDPRWHPAARAAKQADID